MRRLIISLFVLTLLSSYAPALAQRGGSRAPIFRPPAGGRGGYSAPVVRPTIPRITRPPRSLDPARRQPIPSSQPGAAKRTWPGRTASGAPAFRAPVPPAGSPQINAARTQAKTTLDQLRTSLRSRLLSGTALSSRTDRSGIPPRARETLQHIEKTGNPPPGYQGGREYRNNGRQGEEVLPKRAPNGVRITYKEYDVNPYRRGVNRGKERLVIGSDGSAYYTKDHYMTFTKIN